MNASDPDSPRGSAQIDEQGGALALLASQLAPAPISLDLLAEFSSALPAGMAAVLGDAMSRERLSARLEETGDANDLGGGTLEFSPPAQAAHRAEMGDEEAHEWLAVALEFLDAAFPADPEELAARERCAELIEHVSHVAERAREVGRDAAVAVVNRGARYCLDTADFERGMELAELNLAISRSPDEPLAGEAQALAGVALREMGEWERARRALELGIEVMELTFPGGEPALRRAHIELAVLELNLGENEPALARLKEAVKAAGEREDAELGWARRMLGWALRDSGDRDSARAQYEQALELAVRIRGKSHSDYANTLAQLSLMDIESGALESAEERLREALAIAEQLDPGGLLVSGICGHLADALLAKGEPVAARLYSERGLGLAEEILPPVHRGLWIRHRKLSTILRNLNATGEARTHAEQALAMCEQLFGPKDGKFARDLGLLAGVDASRGDLERAQKGYEEAISISARNREASAEEVARYRQLLGRVLRDQGDLPGARDRIAEALQVFAENEEGEVERIGAEIDLADIMARIVEEASTAALALKQPQTAQALEGQALQSFEAVLERVLEGTELWMAISVADAARGRSPQLAMKALGRAEELHAEDSPVERLRLASAWHRLGQGQSKDAEHRDAARRAFERALELLEGYEHFQAMVHHEIGNLFYAEDEFASAAERYREAVEIRRGLTDNADPRALAGSLISLGRCLEEEQEYDTAMAAYEEQLGVLRELSKPDQQAEGVALHDMADVLLAQGKPEEAAKLYRRAVENKRSAGEIPGDLAVSLRFLGACLERLEDYAGAIEAYRERLEVLESIERHQPEREAEACHDLAEALLALERGEEAAPYYARAVELFREANPAGDRLAFALFGLGRTLEGLGALAAAAAAYEERLAILPSLTGEMPQAEGVTLHDLADVRKAQERLEDAVELYRRAADLKRKAGSEAPDGSLARTLLALAGAEHSRERGTPAARQSAEAAVAAFREVETLDPRQLASALVLQADSMGLDEEADEAAAAYEEAAGLFAQAPELDKMEFASMQFLAAEAYAAAGRDQQAEGARAAGVSTLRDALDEELPEESVLALPAIGISAVRSNARELALQIAERLRKQIESLPEDEKLRHGLAQLLFEIGRDLEAEDDADGAIAVYSERLALLRTLSKPDRFAEGVTLHDLGDIELGRERAGDAVAHYRQAIERKRQAGTAMPPAQLALSLIGAARALLNSEEEARPLELLEEAIGIYRELGPGTADPLAASLCALAECELRDGRATEALAAIEESKSLLEQNPSHDKPIKRAVLEELSAEALEALGQDEDAATARSRAEELRDSVE